MLFAVAVVLAADPAACTRVDRLEKQLAAVWAPLPTVPAGAERSWPLEHGEKMLRALTTVEPGAVDELVAAKKAARERVVAFGATLAKDGDLAFYVEQSTLPALDWELAQLERVKRVFTAKRAAEAKKVKALEWEKLFAPDESTLRDELQALQSHASSATYLEPVIGWFGLGLSSPAEQCAPAKTAARVLFESGKVTAGPGWFSLTEGLDLEGLVKLSAKVKTVREVSVSVPCGPVKAVPKLRYDAAARVVEYEWLSREKCLGEKIRGALSLNLPDHGSSSGAAARPEPPRIPAAEWAALRQKLLAP
ncbi:MAG: hypothetical protein JNK82_12540 [Myxococcaceae bacterium]|nr:hypothetical protein [Myxococcaceae bacterium]